VLFWIVSPETIIFGQISGEESNEKVVQQILSSNPSEADAAVIEPLRREERIVPLLFHNKVIKFCLIQTVYKKPKKLKC